MSRGRRVPGDFAKPKVPPGPAWDPVTLFEGLPGPRLRKTSCRVPDAAAHPGPGDTFLGAYSARTTGKTFWLSPRIRGAWSYTILIPIVILPYPLYTQLKPILFKPLLFFNHLIALTPILHQFSFLDLFLLSVSQFSTT